MTSREEPSFSEGASPDSPISSDRWHHRPSHLFLPDTSYIITASTLHKKHLFVGDERLRYLETSIFHYARLHSWNLEAWAVFPNHYHLIAVSPDLTDPDAGRAALTAFLKQLHSETARGLNRIDNTAGRQVWFQFRDTCLTYEKSYYARLNYVHNNPVKHGLVARAELYPYCSARWFQTSADPSFRAKLSSFGWQRVKIDDDF
jgi:putative transposase